MKTYSCTRLFRKFGLIPFNWDNMFCRALVSYTASYAAGNKMWRRWAKTWVVRLRKSPAIHFRLSLTQTYEVEVRAAQCKWECVEKILWIQHRKDFLSEVSHYPGNNLQTCNWHIRFPSRWETVISRVTKWGFP